MKKTSRSAGRRRVVRFRSPPSAEDKSTIRNMLLDSGAREVEFEGGCCAVRYPFPEMSLDEIIVLLSSASTPHPEKRLFESVVMFMEKNERSHVISGGGWKHNVEDVYIHYFNLYAMEREDIRRQTWRKYKT